MQMLKTRAAGGFRALKLVLAMGLAACASAAQAQVTWTGNGDGVTWSQGANWSTNTPPQSGDNVTISIATNPTIVSNGNVTINSLVCDENLRLTGGTFTVTTTADLNATLTLEGANLTGGSWDVTGGAFHLSNATNFITNAAITGDLLFPTSSSRVRIAGNTTFTRARFQSSAGGIGFPPGYVLNSEIVNESTSSNYVEMNGTAGTFTVGPTGVLRATSTGTLNVGGGFWFGGNMNLVNLGTISDDVGGAAQTTAHVNLNAATISNRGLIRASNGGVVQLGSNSGTFVNEAAVVAPPQPGGTITVGDGSRASLLGNWDNNGTLTVGGSLNSVPARLTLDGVNESADLGTFTSAGEVFFIGTLNNTGGTLTLPAGGSYTIDGGRINGGTLNQTANPLRFATGDNRLFDLQVQGDLILDVSSARVRIEGSSSFGILRMRGSGSGVSFSPGYILTGQVIFEGAGAKYLELVSAGTFTIAPAGRISTSSSPDATGTSSIGASNFLGGAMTIINQGIITHNSSGTLVIGQSASVSPLFTNAAGATVAKTGTGPLQISSGAWSNQGTITSNAGTLSFNGNWNNSGGTLNLTDTTINLGGTFSTTQLGTINRTGGTTNLTGTLNNTGSTLALTNTTGSWNLVGGTINGGTVTESGSATLRFGNADSGLNNVTLSQDLALLDSSSRVRLLGSNTIGRIRLVGQGSAVGFAPGSTFGGEIIAEGTGGARYIESTTNNGALTLSPTARVVSAAGFGGQLQFVGNWYGTPAVTNQGTIDLDNAAASASLTLGNNSTGTTFSNAATGVVRATTGAAVSIPCLTITNAGTIRVDNDTLTLSGTWSNTGTIQIGGSVATPGTLVLGGSFAASSLGTINRTGTTTVRIDGSFNLGGGSFSINAQTGDYLLGSGTIRNGTLNQVGGARLLTAQSTGELLDVTLPQELVVGSSGRIRIQGASGVPNIRLAANDAGVAFAPGAVYGGTIIADGPTGERSVETITPGTLEFSASAVLRTEGGAALRFGSSYWFSNSTTVTNRGRITSGAAGRTVAAGGQNFINAAGAILESQNGGQISISASTWSNAGLITITPASTFTFAGNWSNAGGVINATDATINVGGTFTRTQLGNFNRSGGTLNITGVLNNAGQTLDLTAAFGDVTLVGGQIVGGTVNQSAARLRFSNSSNPNRLTDVAVLGDLRMSMSSGNLSIEGSTSFPRIRVSASSNRIVVPANFTFGGEILVEAGGDNTGLSNAGAGTFTLAPTGRIAVSGNSAGLYFGSYWITTPGMTVVNQGVMEVLGTNAVLEYYNQSVFANTAGTVTSGTYRTRNGGKFSFIQPPSANATQPTILAIGPGVVFDLEGNVNNFPVPFTGLSTLRQVDGTLRVSGPDLAITPQGGTLTNNGLVSTGPGTALNITGAYQMGPTATHEATIVGSTAAQYGTTVVSGNAAVDGTFRLLAPGFEPGCGLRYLPIDAATLSGTFDTVNLPPPSPNSVIVFEYRPGGVGVRGFVGVSGFSYADFNNDGVVDDFDFVLFTQQYEVFACDDPLMPGNCSADLNDDGFVDDFDFVLFTIAYEAFLCP